MTTQMNSDPGLHDHGYEGRRNGLSKRLLIGLLVLAIAAAAAGVGVIGLGVFLVRSSSTESSAAEPALTSEQAMPVPNPVAYGYFGETEIAQGSTLNISTAGTSTNIASADDIRITSIPPGLTAKIVDGESVELEVAVPRDFPAGRYSIVFDITGEPSPVEWIFAVTQA